MTNDKERSQIRVMHQEVSYQGPIPPASELKQYSEIDQTIPSRIITMAEKQQNHRHELELYSVKSNARNSLLGVVFAGCIGLGGIVSATILTLYGYSAIGLATVVTSLASLAGVYMYGRSQSRKENAERDKLIANMYKE